MNPPTAFTVIANVDDADNESVTRSVTIDCPTDAGRTRSLVISKLTRSTGNTTKLLLDTTVTVRVPVPSTVPNVNVAESTPTVP